MKRACVTGAGGFIGGHLVRALKAHGYWVRGVDIKLPDFRKTAADEFVIADLRDPRDVARALVIRGGPFDEVYALAADMGGMGFISKAECEIVRHNALINLNTIHAASQLGVGRYFFASSVCVYRDMDIGEPEMAEDGAYPAYPANEYGWEKLYSERVVMTYARHYPIQVRIARFENTYGPYGTWRGGREKAPAAICRKVAEVEDGGEIDVWGDGTAVRSYTYVDDLVRGICALMQSDLEGPCNIGRSEYVSVNDLVDVVARVAGKRIRVRHVDGPVGVQSRNFSHARIESIGWRSEVSLEEGIARTYPWILQQVEGARCV